MGVDSRVKEILGKTGVILNTVYYESCHTKMVTVNLKTESTTVEKLGDHTLFSFNQHF